MRLTPSPLDLGAQFLHLLVEALDRLLLHVDQLRHRISRLGLLPDLVVYETLRLRIARLVRRLFEALKNPRNDLAFLAVHDVLLQSRAATVRLSDKNPAKDLSGGARKNCRVLRVPDESLYGAFGVKP